MNFQKKRLLLLDSSSVLHRAFHALPPLKTKKGEIVGAVYGFLLAFFRVLKDFQPRFVIACFDLPVPTFRHKAFKDYKAQRPPTPKELQEQIPRLREVLKRLKIFQVEKKGFEADDLIGSISKKEAQKGTETIIVTADLDLLQLVDEKTKVYLLKRGVKKAVLYDRERVKKRYSGLKPEQLDDLRALKGDASDNIPGVPGIGRKTATKLLAEFSTVEDLYRYLEKGAGKRIKDRTKILLLQEKEKAFLSKRLAEIRKDLSLGVDIKKAQWGKYNKEEVIDIFEELEFSSLIQKLPGEGGDKKKEKNLTLW